MQRALVLGVAGLLGVVLAPVAHGEDPTSVVSFYGHVFGLGRAAPMPMNTQLPLGESDLSGAIVAACGQPGVTTCEDSPDDEVWLYSTAGFVQVKNAQEFAYDKLHNERGLTKDTRLDTTQDVTADFYMSADEHGFPSLACAPGAPHDVPWPVPCWNWDPGVLVQWQVQATIYTGVLGAYGGEADTAPDVAAAVAGGQLRKLAEGVSAPQDVRSLEPLGSPTVWKFPVNLGHAARETIAKEESYLVRLKWWGVKPDGSRQILPGYDLWNANSGEYFPPVVRLPVKDAFTVELVVPQFVHGKLVILGVMNTPWGSYDVDQDSIRLAITDRQGNGFEPVHLARLADFTVAHGGHYKPVNVTYVWDYALDRLPPGEYSATVSATNHQGSASASCAARFTIMAGGGPGAIEVGECGPRTISDEQLGRITEGSAQDAKGPMLRLG